MAGNILYIPYTSIMIVGLISFVVVIKLKRGKRAAQIFSMISIPILILFQFYFWNLEFNDYVKSYLYPSKVFQCEDEEELKNTSIPLPERTVFKGKQDGCSPFYSTYVSVGDFKSFYEEELKTLKDKGKIQKYDYIERNDRHWTDNKGFVVELSSGSKMEIFIHRRVGIGVITIDYQPNK